MSRLADGGLIDRARPLRFMFDGTTYQGFAGDTLASALLANDVRLIGRSFKYHRPRGILTAGSEEPSGLVTLRRGAQSEPNTRATTAELFEGLEATSQNCWPSRRFDLLSVNQLAAPVIAAGFYYKTFMWPAPFWERVYEPLIRRAAGLGALSGDPDPDHYDRAHGFCDLLVIGAGPAGLAAALTAGRAGLRVFLAESDTRLGGRLLCETHTIDGAPGVQWGDDATRELQAMANVRVLTRTSVFGVYDGREYGAVERLTDHLPAPPPGRARQRLWKIIARRAILASGAIELPLVFGGNDRPGVMMASAVSSYLHRFGVSPGTRAVVFTCSDSGWRTAADLHRAGVSLAAVIDSRARAPALAETLNRAGIAVYTSAVIADVHGAPARACTIIAASGQRLRIAADLIAMAGGWNPLIGLGAHLGHKPQWSERLQTFLLDRAPPGLAAAGAAAGAYALGDALAGGAAAGMDAVKECGRGGGALPRWSASPELIEATPLWHVAARRRSAFVDFQHDVTDKDIALAAREGFSSVEHLKRYTTLGMASDQGKTSQLNGHALLAAATGKTIAEAGTIRARPPAVPIALGVLAGAHRGRHFRPVRETASHQWAAGEGAVFVDAGLWKRAQWYARPGEVHWLASVNREVLATRNGVGVCDVSTLGKIDVQGPDAGTLLDRLYINSVSTLSVGRARYGVMLREDGFVMDDGTTTRLAEDRFFLTTTTVNALKVMQHIDFARQVLWPELDVQATSVTEQWALYAVAGPHSRALLQSLFAEVDLSNEALPYLGAVSFFWRGLAVRIARLSFSGELAYEVSVPADSGDIMIRSLMNAGREFGVAPYGTEALGVMRIEKGHVAGNEINGQTTAGDLGLGRMLSRKKDFIGRVMAGRPGLVDPARPSLVGLRPAEGKQALRAGAHLVAPGVPQTAANDEGYVTSSAYSPTLGHPIALALLRHGPKRHGERIIVHDPVRGGDAVAEICSPMFLDPEGERLRG